MCIFMYLSLFMCTVCVFHSSHVFPANGRKMYIKRKMRGNSKWNTAFNACVQAVCVCITLHYTTMLCLNSQFTASNNAHRENVLSYISHPVHCAHKCANLRKCQSCVSLCARQCHCKHVIIMSKAESGERMCVSTVCVVFAISMR